MNYILSFDAFLFPSDGRPPHLVQLSNSLNSPHLHKLNSQTTGMPHPEMYMDEVAKDSTQSWQYHVCCIRTFAIMLPVDAVTVCRTPLWHESELYLRQPIRCILPNGLA